MRTHFPKKFHLVPSPAGIDTSKLGGGGVIMTDTCNTAQKVRRINVDQIAGTYELDCMNHLRNVWFGNIEKALSAHLNALLRSSLDEIDPQLRVTASVSAVIRAVDKEFSLSSNYPKGHGKLFWNGYANTTQAYYFCTSNVQLARDKICVPKEAFLCT